MLNEPYLTISRQFLITNKSNYIKIINYLDLQFNIAINDFNIDSKNLKL